MDSYEYGNETDVFHRIATRKLAVFKGKVKFGCLTEG